MVNRGIEVPDTTLAWLAALIDGEGSIMFNMMCNSQSRMKHTAAKKSQYRAEVVIWNTNIDLMKAIVEQTGINRIATHSRPEGENKKPCHRWRMTGTECREWLPKLLPYLICKKQHAILLLEALEIKNKLTSKKGKVWLSKLEIEALTNRLDKIYNKIKNLNKRGLK